MRICSFAAGAREAKNDSVQSYADYNANSFAFSIGYENFHQIAKKKGKVSGYIYHGFERGDTGLIYCLFVGQI